MPTPTAASWVKFFTNAEIPSPAAATYAHVFVENRIQMDMLMDLNKEYLREMGITTMGDIIAILRHAKKVADQSAREKVLSVPETELGVPVATVSGTPNTGTAGNGKKTENLGFSRPISSTLKISNPSTSRRVLPEHEGKYKVILPTGSTARSREILEKKEASSGNDNSARKTAVKRGSIFDRLSNDDEPPLKMDSKAQKVEQMSSPVTSSIFSRLGGRKSNDNGKEDAGISQKVILVKKIPAKASALLSEDFDDYQRIIGNSVDVNAGGGLKSVSFSEEDEVLEIAPRKVHTPGQLGGSPAGRLRFNESTVSLKQRLGVGTGGTVSRTAIERSPSLHATKKVVHLKHKKFTGSIEKPPAARASLKSDAMMHVRKQPVHKRLSLDTGTNKRVHSKPVERFSLDSKLSKAGKRATSSTGSVFDRLGYNRK